MYQLLEQINDCNKIQKALFWYLYCRVVYEAISAASSLNKSLGQYLPDDHSTTLKYESIFV